MSLVDIDHFSESANNDPEFLIAARFRNTFLKIEMEDSNYILKIQDGKIVRVNSTPAPDDPWAIKIGAPGEDWKNFLETIPKPFYHDLIAAGIRHNFVCEGDLESFYAYYPAIRRMFEIMRSSASI